MSQRYSQLSLNAVKLSLQNVLVAYVYNMEQFLMKNPKATGLKKENKKP